MNVIQEIKFRLQLLKDIKPLFPILARPEQQSISTTVTREDRNKRNIRFPEDVEEDKAIALKQSQKITDIPEKNELSREVMLDTGASRKNVTVLFKQK